MTELGLRERSRVRRHAAIERAALQLFAERGYDATTIAQVGEEAEVAARTVTMYFPSKLHLALSYLTDAVRRLEQALVARRAGASSVDVTIEWLRAEMAEHRESMTLQAAMLQANPELRGVETAELTQSRAAITVAIAADLGRDPDDVVVGVVGGAFEGVINVLIQLGPEAVDADRGDDAFDTAVRVLAAAVQAAKPRILAS